MLVSSEAVVLHSKKFGDSSRIITAYSKDYGKISLLAKGAYKSKNKFGYSVEPLSLSFFTFYKKENADLHLLSSGELLTNLYNIREDFDKMIYALLICESIEQTQEKESPNTELYDLIKKALIAVNNKNEPFSAFVHTQIRLAEILGFAFNFHYNFNLNEDEDIYSFYLFTGEISQRKPVKEKYFAFKPYALNYLKKISLMDIEEASDVKAENFPIFKLFNFFMEYFTYQLEKKFRYNSVSLLNGASK